MSRLRLRVVKCKRFILFICFAILAVFTFRMITVMWHSVSISPHRVPTSKINSQYWYNHRYVVLRSLTNTKDNPATVATLIQNPASANESSPDCHCTCPNHGDYANSNTSSNTSHKSEPTHTFSVHSPTTSTPVQSTDDPVLVPSSSDSEHASGSGEYDSNITQSSDVQNTTATEKEYLLFVAILSQYQGYNSRVAIRKTWMNNTMHEQDSNDSLILVKFVIGTMNLPTAAVENLTAEEDANHDLLLLPNLVDDYDNLTRKVLYTLVWADENVNFSYLLKCDTDSFVLLDRLAKELSKRPSTKDLYWGYFVGFNKPSKEGRWPEHKWFLCDHYLPYAVGGGYVISSNLVHRLAVNSDGLQLYVCEDVSVGVWLSPFSIERKHDVRFNTGHKSRGCSNQYLISHKQSPEDMYQQYSNLLKTGRLCESEISLFHSYAYNWRTQPTKCCTRRKHAS